jgi:anti-anti-sigma factor
MNSKVNTAKGVLRISGDMTVYSAAELKAALLAANPASTKVKTLDLSAVSEMDCAGLQLLLATLRQPGRKEKPLRLVAASQSVRDVLELCQRADLLPGAAP